MMYLKKTIKSSINPSCTYGKQGDKVEVISHDESVAIVEGEKGRFPVQINYLSQTPVAPEASTTEEPKKKRRK